MVENIRVLLAAIAVSGFIGISISVTWWFILEAIDKKKILGNKWLN